MGTAISLMTWRTDLNFKSQENINAITDSITKDEVFDEELIGKASSNITVDGVEYSKDGIDGDNPFARRCGIENAVKTYVSDLGIQAFADTWTGYAKAVSILILSEENGEFKVTKAEFGAESRSDYTDEQVYKNLLIDNDIKKSFLNNEMQIVNLGENMKNEQSQTPTDPEEALDFSALEAKLEEISEVVKPYYTLKEILSYSIKDGNIYLVLDAQFMNNNKITVYKSTNIYDFSNQSKINEVVNSITKDDFVEVSDLMKAKSQITVTVTEKDKDGNDVKKTYTSENGTFVGNNPFARQCGIENAVKTYVSKMGNQGFADFGTGYGREVSVLVVSKDKSNDTIIKLSKFAVESKSNYTQKELYENLVTDGKNKKISEEVINIGENIKDEQSQNISYSNGIEL